MRLIKSLKVALVSCCILLVSCGDFPEYYYDQSQDYCEMSFPFAGGIIGRQYVGFVRIISSLQYLDDDPTYKVIITGPSHIELETGSVQKIRIGEKSFRPRFKKNHLESTMQLWGPAFLFEQSQSDEIVKLLRDGHDITIHGRLEVGHQYETDIYNFFYSSKEKPFKSCINRLLDEEDLAELAKKSN